MNLPRSYSSTDTTLPAQVVILISGASLSRSSSSMAIKMNFGAFLQHCGISAYRLVKATEGRLTPATVYGLVSKTSQCIDLARCWMC